MLWCVRLALVFYSDFVIAVGKSEFNRERYSGLDKVDEFFAFTLDSDGFWQRLDIDIEKIFFGYYIFTVFAIEYILDASSGGLEDIEKPIVIFSKIFFVAATVEIMFDESSERSSSSDTELLRVSIEEYHDQLIGGELL